MSREIAPFGLRIPKEMKDYLIGRAKENRRSLNAEILDMIQLVLENPAHGGPESSNQVNEPGAKYATGSIDVDRLTSISKLIRGYVNEDGGGLSEDRISALIAKAYDAINADGAIDLRKVVKLVETAMNNEPPKAPKNKTAKA